MSKEKGNETLGDELLIEELGEVRGGVARLPKLTLALGLGEEPGRNPFLSAPKPFTTPAIRPIPGVLRTALALGEEGSAVVPAVLRVTNED